MSDYVIISDSSCDLNAQLRERFGITDYIRGVLYHPDGHSEPADLDWTGMTPDEYFGSMRNRKVLYKSAAPEMGEAMTVFEKYLSQGLDILSVNISTGLSSTVNDLTIASKEILEKYPDRKIIIVNSLRYSTGQALLTMLAGIKKSEGATIEENAAYLNEIKYSIHQMGILDDLFFCVKTGRVSNFKAFFGSMVGLNMLSDFNNEKGLSEVIGKVKGKNEAFQVIIEYIRQTIVDPENQIIFIAHSLREEHAKRLGALVEEAFHPKEIIYNSVGMMCGANIGPGLCNVFYQGNVISEGTLKEKALLDKIITELKEKK